MKIQIGEVLTLKMREGTRWADYKHTMESAPEGAQRRSTGKLSFDGYTVHVECVGFGEYPDVLLKVVKVEYPQ